ncbi:MAG: biotin/lipoyl-binding protein [Bacteriovoracaceae bacterium]|nr:biotin/lipoyl-binding protein [Bacteriovoracaceae bacterium]
MFLDKVIEKWATDDSRFKITIMRSFWFIFLLFFGLMFIPWIQTSFMKGKVIAYYPEERRFELHSPIEGRLKKWLVSEGEKVSKGQILLEISDNDPEIMERIQSEKLALERQLESTKLAAKTSELNVSRQRKLFQQGLSSQLNYERANIEYSKNHAEQSKIEGEIERLNVRLSRQEQLTITSPIEGILVRVLKNSTGGSQYVKSGETLAIISPQTRDMAVEFWINGNDLPIIHPGREVRIQFEGWPVFYFSGWPEYSYGTFRGTIKIIDALDDGHGNFRAIVIPDNINHWPPEEILRQGMLARGWVLLDEVSLGFELWRQFNGFPNNYLKSNQTIDKKIEKNSKNN